MLSAPPTQIKAYQELVQDEITKRLTEPCSTKSFGDAQLINIGIDLENEQCVRLLYMRNKLTNDPECIYVP